MFNKPDADCLLRTLDNLLDMNGPTVITANGPEDPDSTSD